MRLDNCFCTNSICTPSRAAILTGQYSHINGVKTLADKIDPQHENVAKDLQASGYQTAMIGKWHLVTNPAGFDFWQILPGQGVYHDPVLIEHARAEVPLGTLAAYERRLDGARQVAEAPAWPATERK